jgi:hypothetical protein
LVLRGQNFSKTSLSHTAPLLWAAGQTNIAVKLHQYGEEHAHLLFCVWRKKKKKGPGTSSPKQQTNGPQP